VGITQDSVHIRLTYLLVYIKSFKILKLILLILASASGMILLQSLVAQPVSAKQDDWINGNFSVERRSDLSTNPDAYGQYGACQYQTVQMPNSYGIYRETRACVFQSKSFRYTINSDGLLFISFADESLMYPVTGIGLRSSNYVVPSPNTDDIIFDTNVINDLPSKITLNLQLTSPYYQPGMNILKSLSVDNLGTDHYVYDKALSKNGKWMALNFRDIGFVLFNLINMKATWIAPNRHQQEFMAVSDDGQHLAVSPFWNLNSPVIYSLHNCGQTANTLKSEWFSTTLTGQCQSRDLGDKINSALGSDWFASNAKPEFSEDDTQLILFVRPNGTGGEGITLTVQPPKSKLDYLALGDSYSSGEGDTGKAPSGKSFYTTPTDYSGGCHVSTRSYPFLVQSNLRISDDRMKSVACSGAHVNQDYYGDSMSYAGQGNRIGKKSATEQQTAKNNALRDFTPGIIKQVDYVKDNKPAFVTLTGGGNDVGFANILTYCALPSGVGDYSNTCEMALDGTKQKSILGDAIKSQYDQTLKLIAAIKAASNDTKIYIIGYPSFVSEKNETCLNAAMLNTKERTMIDRSVSYLNSILNQAAKAGGAFYVDVEKSLYGGRICEGSKYMTGPLNVLGLDMMDHNSEMFHPNYLAHQEIAKSIVSAGISTEGDNPTADQSVSSPDKPDFFGNSTYVPTFQDKIIKDEIINLGRAMQVSISPGVFAANQALNFTIWSNETKLGALSTNSQGTLEGELSLPSSVTPGYHLLLAEGHSPSGEPTRIYQFVEVQSSDNDADGDGIANNNDTCEFITTWYDEQSGKDICKTTALPKSPGTGLLADYAGKGSEEHSWGTSGEGNHAKSNGAVLGISDTNELAKNSPQANSKENIQLVAGLSALLALFGILLFAKFVRR
jgi:lysophospholipase L1-like esterase